jgi:hypothetical protein
VTPSRRCDGFLGMGLAVRHGYACWSNQSERRAAANDDRVPAFSGRGSPIFGTDISGRRAVHLKEHNTVTNDS